MNHFSLSYDLHLFHNAITIPPQSIWITWAGQYSTQSSLPMQKKEVAFWKKTSESLSAGNEKLKDHHTWRNSRKLKCVGYIRIPYLWMAIVIGPFPEVWECPLLPFIQSGKRKEVTAQGRSGGLIEVAGSTFEQIDSEQGTSDVVSWRGSMNAP